jgi:hypothetical protein
MATLSEIAEKELSGIPFTDEERRFLRSVIYHHYWETVEICTRPHEVERETGWYRDLYFDDPWDDTEQPAREPDALIADVHTDPNSPGYEILHVGTGDPETPTSGRWRPTLSTSRSTSIA